MNLNILAFLFSAGAVTLAEMGDKTQLLAMAFAAKYKASKVLIGVLVATVLNHALAVAVGNYFARIQAFHVWIETIAALSFIFFGLWTLKGDTLEGEENKSTRFGPIITVVIAFFIAELGDKTQLATIALAARFEASPVAVLMGTTTGMLIADAIGILCGALLCTRFSGNTIKLFSAGIFILFGFWGVFEAALKMFHLSLGTTLATMFVLLVFTALAARKIVKNQA
jgi:putative Ca2+/H+ antiporter (TMEM165/GDT1 family)